MVRTAFNVLIVSIIFCSCFGCVRLSTIHDNHRIFNRAFYNVFEESSYTQTLALILDAYLLINRTSPMVWNNPMYAEYDQHLIYSLQKQLEESDSYFDDQTLQADPVPLLPLAGGLKFLTYYCGPGNWSVDGSTVQSPYFSSIDQCCKQHDECPDVIVNRDDYQRYIDLPHKNQLFTSLRCHCDVEFLQCLKHISTFFSYAVAWIYTKFQSSCFDYKYPVRECIIKKNDGIFSTDRCLTYLVDNSFHKKWQWFDVPYISSNQFYFPELQYHYEMDWFNIYNNNP